MSPPDSCGCNSEATTSELACEVLPPRKRPRRAEISFLLNDGSVSPVKRARPAASSRADTNGRRGQDSTILTERTDLPETNNVRRSQTIVTNPVRTEPILKVLSGGGQGPNFAQGSNRREDQITDTLQPNENEQNASESPSETASGTREEAQTDSPRDVLINEVPCDECDYLFGNAEAVQRHKRLQHTSTPSPSQDFVCPECNLVLKNRQNLNRHVDKAHGPDAGLACADCDAMFKTDRSLALHKNRAHGQQSVHKRGTAEKSYPCSFSGCTYASNQKTNVARHFDGVHRKIRKYGCPHCEYRATTKNNLQAHVMVHTRNNND